MKKNLILLSILVAFNIAAQEDLNDTQQFVAEIDQSAPKLLNDYLVPGVAIAIIDNGEIILQKGYGYSNKDKNTKVTTTTGFNIGSISKTVAAWGVMKLVEEGKLDLDSTAEKYLTRWHLPESKYDVNEVTLRRLLSHTAGLSLHGYPGWSPKDTLPTIEESLNGKNNGPGRVELIMEPGTKYKYSGGGYTILQLIIEEVTGEKFASYMQREILDPLGMTNSSYKIDGKILSASSNEHNFFGEEIDFELFTAQAAAGLHTTIEDFTKFAMAGMHKNKLNSKQKQILSNEAISEMMEPADMTEGRYGLGYQVDSIRGTSITLRGHGGANTGWHAFLRVNPDTNDGFAVITNGGAGHNVYRKLFCDWIYWKTGTSLGDRCKFRIPIANKMKQFIDNEGTTNIRAFYDELKNNKPDTFNFSERQLNRLGYYYLGKEMVENAVAIFKLNVDLFPNSGNVYDSYGEALLKRGDKDMAIENYLKSVEVYPGNENGIKVLNDLGVSTDHITKEVSVEDHLLQSYVGRYELSPNFIITISKEGNQMKAQATGQIQVEIYPRSETVFYLKVVEAQLTFNLNDIGQVESVTLLQGGNETTGLKLEN
jgi:CubicO group peptidase (beta-lactamase class C family)